MKKVSVIITLYNLKHFAQDAIQSVVNQTYENRECIIVDDCSTDGSFEFVRELIESRYFDYKDRFVVVQNPTNLRVGKTFEHGLQYATGDYIADLDADDVRLPNKLEVQIHYMDQNPDVIMSCHELIVTDEKLNILSDGLIKDHWKINALAVVKDKLLFFKNCVYVGSSIVFRKSLTQFLVPFSEKTYQDIWIASVACIKGNVGYIDQGLCLYRQHGSNSEGAKKPNFIKTVRKYLNKKKMKQVLQTNVIRYSDYYWLMDLMLKKEGILNADLVNYVAQKQMMYFLLNERNNKNITTFQLLSRSFKQLQLGNFAKTTLHILYFVT